MNGTPAVIKMLLEQKANPNSKTKKARAEVNTDKHSSLDGLVLRMGGESNPKWLRIWSTSSSRSQLAAGIVAKTICLVDWPSYISLISIEDFTLVQVMTAGSPCRKVPFFFLPHRSKGPLQVISSRKSNGLRIAVLGPVLAICARFKNHEAMKLLIEAGAAVNSKAVHSPLGIGER